MIRLAKTLWLVFLLSLSILIALLLGALVISPSPDIEGIEQNVVYSLQLMISGKPLYSNPELPPYNVVQYTPAYYAIAGVLASVFRIEADYVYGVYLIGRAVSLIFALGIYIIIWWLARDFGARGLILLSSLVFAVIGPIPWFLSVRPDSMVVFFEFLAVFLFVHYLQTEKQAGLWITFAGMALAFGFYSKQTAILFMGLFFIFPFYRQWLRDRMFLALGIGLGLLISAVLFLPYAQIWPLQDNPFYMNVVDGVTNSTSVERALWVYDIYLTVYFPFILLPMAVSLLVAFMLWQDSQQQKKNLWQRFAGLDKLFSFLLFMFWGVTAAAFVMSFKSASAINYFNESMLLAALLLAYFLSNASIPIRWQNSHGLRWGSALLLLLSVFTIGDYLIYNYGSDAVIRSGGISIRDTLDVLDAEFAEHPNAYFIYFPDFIYDRSLNLYGYENTLFEPREVYKVAYFDLSSLRGYLEDGSVRLLITDKVDFPDDIYGYTDMENYFELWQETEWHLIYRNRNSD